jgi:hypothetical protein
MRQLLFYSILALAMTVSTAYACKCAQLAVDEKFHECDSIFTAEVIGTAPGDVTQLGFTAPGQRIYLRVIESFKGEYLPANTDAFSTFKENDTACGITTHVGEQLLVYKYRRFDWFIGRCNSSRGDSMNSDLTAIRNFLLNRDHAG